MKRQAITEVLPILLPPAAQEAGATDIVCPIVGMRQPLPIPRAKVTEKPNRRLHAKRGSTHNREQTTGSLSTPNTIGDVIALWRMRQAWVRAETALKLRGIALCRRYVSQQSGVEPGQKLAKEQLASAKAMFEGELSGDAPIDDLYLSMGLSPIVAALIHMRPSLRYSAKELKAQGSRTPDRDFVEARLEQLVKTLPVWEWVSQVSGFGAGNFAGLVGEAGNVGSYRNPACVWKRMGLAVFGGQRQRRVTDAEMAVLMGYNPSRHAVAWVLSDCLVKGKSKYRQTYLDRKAYELAREDENKPKSLMHAHKRAQRYMLKRVLRDLWSAWRATMTVVKTSVRPLPAFISVEQTEQQTNSRPEPKSQASAVLLPPKGGRSTNIEAITTQGLSTASIPAE